MKTFTNLAHRAFKKCASLGTINKKRYYLFIITMLLTLGVGNAWGAEIVFKTNTSDANGALATNTLKDEVSSGADYIASVGSDIAKVFPGKSGLKFGNSSTGVL